MKRPFLALAFLVSLATMGLAQSDSPAAAPQKVGALGSPGALDIFGAKTFSEEELRAELAGSAAYLAAAHPAAPLEPYIAKVGEELAKGYRHSGFRDARVTAKRSVDRGRVQVQVEEGPRFLRGEIRILGAQRIAPEPLIAELTQKPAPPADPLPNLVTNFLEERAAPKRKAAAEALAKKAAPAEAARTLPLPGASLLAKSPEVAWMEALVTPKRLTVFWEPGKPFSFGPDGMREAETALLRLLQNRGEWLTQVKAETEVDAATGRAHLIYQLTEGPKAIFGKIQVVGDQRNQAEEIVAASGLRPGAAFTSDAIRQANLALWNTARFINFELTPQRPDEQKPEIDLTIDVEECPDMPPLSKALSRDQAALVKFANWLTAQLPKQEFVITIPRTSGDETKFAFSPADGLVLLFGDRAQGEQLGISASPKEFEVLAAANGKFAHAVGSVQQSGFMAFLNILPGPRDRQPGPTWKSVGFGGGFANRAADAPVVKLESMFAPVALCTYNQAIVKTEYSGGILRVEDPSPETRMKLQFHEATGELVSLDQSFTNNSYFDAVSVRPASGEVARLRARLAELAKGAAPKPGTEAPFLELLTRMKAVRALVDGFGGEHSPAEWETIAASARAIERLGRAGISFANSVNAAADDDDDDFSIPSDMSSNPSWITAMVGPLYFRVAHALWPEDAWPTRLSREIFYIMAGQILYTPKVLDELYRDPKMGPLGSLLAAMLLERIDPPSAARFYQRATERNSTGDLDNDLALLDGRGRNAKYLGGLAAELGALEPAVFAGLVEHLGQGFAGHLNAWRASLTEQPPADPMATLLPAILLGWRDGGREIFRTWLARANQGRVADGHIAAAMVDGLRVSRQWVETIGPKLKLDERVAPLPPGPLAAKNDEQRMLDAAISLHLVLREFMYGGVKFTNEEAQTAMQNFAGGDMRRVQAMFQRVPLAPMMLNTFVSQWTAYRALEQRLAAGLGPATAEELRAAEEEKLKPLRERLHLRYLRAAKDDEGRKALAQIRTELEQAGFQERWKKLAEKKGGPVEASEFEEVDRDTLNESLTTAAFALGEKATSEIVESGEFLYLLHIVRKGAPEETLAEGRKAAAVELEQTRLHRAVSKHLAKLRAEAVITLLEPPPILPVAPPEKGVVRLEAEDLKVVGSEKAQARVQSMAQWDEKLWSGGKQMGVGGQPGGWVEWEFDFPGEGHCLLTLHATRASNFSSIRVCIDDQPIGPEIDLFAVTGVLPSGPRVLGAKPLSRGKHKLKITLGPQHPEALQADFGFDALDLRFGQPEK